MQWFVHADLAGVRLLSAPLAMEHLTGRTPVESLWDRWAEGVLAGRSSYAAWKRLLDIGVVVLASPFLLVLAGAVCLIVLFSSGWPVLFAQERMGEGGVPFRMYKFRSMRTDAEHAGPAFASHGDPRVTPVGRLLRKFRLDELPQFWNVLKGEMSIIGPRPEQAGFSTMFEASLPHYGLRHVVRPGITGWAQVMQGYTTDETETTEKLRYDLYYVRHCSFLLDLEIVVRTTGIVFTGFGSR
jgi:lipopolysaccharide/colanic/teichoic acid biosynthesis glycosyltransferase